MSKSLGAQLLVLASPWLALELGRATALPDWVAIASTFAALKVAPEAACLWAAAAGLLEDVPGGTPFGLGGARRALAVALLVGRRRELAVSSPFGLALVAATLAFADKLGLALALAFFTSDGVSWGELGAQAGKIALATGAVALLVWPALELVATTASGRREIAPGKRSRLELEIGGEVS